MAANTLAHGPLVKNARIRCRAVVVAMQRQTAAKGGAGGGLVYPDNSVVTVLFYSLAAAITSNLLPFHGNNILRLETMARASIFLIYICNRFVYTTTTNIYFLTSSFLFTTDNISSISSNYEPSS